MRKEKGVETKERLSTYGRDADVSDASSEREDAEEGGGRGGGVGWRRGRTGERGDNRRQ